MGAALAEAEVRPGGGGIDRAGRGAWYFGGGGGGEGALGINTAQLGLWVLLGSLTMLFAAFTSAYLVRRTASDWARIETPPLLWVNTVILLASSASMEMARRQFRTRKRAFGRWSLITFVLGGSFLVGQIMVWRKLAEGGIYIASNPHSSFFYVLTGVHAAHVIAGVGALLYILLQSWRQRVIPEGSRAPGLCATYWHFVGAIWIYLFCVLFLL